MDNFRRHLQGHRRTVLFLPSGAAAREPRFMCYFGLKEFVCVFVDVCILVCGHMHVWMSVPILLRNPVCLCASVLCVFLHQCVCVILAWRLSE